MSSRISPRRPKNSAAWLEHREAAIRIAHRHAELRGRCEAVLERDQQRLGRREPRGGIAIDQAIDDRCELRIDARRRAGEPREILAADDAAQRGHRHPGVRRAAGE
jgi:hypothetical protein